MSVRAVTIAPPTLGQTVRYGFSDALTMTWRNLVKYLRLPTLLVFSTVQPVMFVLLFAYVFGGAIRTPGGNYIDFLMPGILVQTVIFGSGQTGIGLADDLSQGMIDRFRSLPMARSAVLIGRVLADTSRNLFVVLLMTGVGYIIGFRFHNGIAAAILALVIVIAFGSLFCLISAFIGLSVRNVETAQVAGFIWVFPLVFASSIFVPVSTMPSWLQAFAKVSPITVTVDAVRHLALGVGTLDLLPPALWMAGILLVFVPLAVRRYRSIT
jgi:ABC-2 type transport system permease protein/oleandomycin transport system permease protein